MCVFLTKSYFHPPPPLDTPEGQSVPVSSSGSGLGPGGSGLLCMEGLPPPVPRNVSSMTTGTDMKQDRYDMW